MYPTQTLWLLHPQADGHPGHKCSLLCSAGAAAPPAAAGRAQLLCASSQRPVPTADTGAWGGHGQQPWQQSPGGTLATGQCSSKQFQRWWTGRCLTCRAVCSVRGDASRSGAGLMTLLSAATTCPKGGWHHVSSVPGGCTADTHKLQAGTERWLQVQRHGPTYSRAASLTERLGSVGTPVSLSATSRRPSLDFGAGAADPSAGAGQGRLASGWLMAG